MIAPTMTLNLKFYIIAEVELLGLLSQHHCHCEEGVARRGNPFSEMLRFLKAIDKIGYLGDTDCHTSVRAGSQ